MTVVVCPKCLYEWDTESTALWVTCPNCMRKSIQEAMRTKPTKCAEEIEK